VGLLNIRERVLDLQGIAMAPALARSPLVGQSQR
jgi:hypothetical protein